MYKKLHIRLVVILAFLCLLISGCSKENIVETPETVIYFDKEPETQIIWISARYVEEKRLNPDGSVIGDEWLIIDTAPINNRVDNFYIKVKENDTGMQRQCVLKLQGGYHSYLILTVIQEG